MKKITWCLLLSLFALLCGCQKAEEAEKETGIKSSVSKANYCITDRGILYKNYENQRVEFLDYASEEYYPLCALPNCRHDDNNCTAVALNKADFFCGYQQHWYYVKSGADNSGEIYEVGLDGTEAKKVGDFSCRANLSGNTVVRNGKLYLATCEDHLDENYQWTGTDSCILEYDLSTGQERILREKQEAMRPTYEILGLWENLLIYSQWDGSQKMLKQLDLEEETDTLVKEGNLVNAGMTGNNLVFCMLEGDTPFLYRLDLQKGTTQELGEGYLQDSFWNGDVQMITVSETAEGDAISYEITEGEWREIRGYNKEERFVPYAQSGDILVGHYGETGTAWMDKEDYLEGNTNWHVLIPTQ